MVMNKNKKSYNIVTTRLPINQQSKPENNVGKFALHITQETHSLWDYFDFPKTQSAKQKLNQHSTPAEQIQNSKISCVCM
jgi:hypothetical protein